MTYPFHGSGHQELHRSFRHRGPAVRRARNRFPQLRKDRTKSKNSARSKRERAEGLPDFASAMGSQRGDSAFTQERKARALVHADLAVLRHFVHRLAALRLPLAEEVDRHFRSLLQFHISRVQRPSLVRVRHVLPHSSIRQGCKKRFPPRNMSDEILEIALLKL